MDLPKAYNPKETEEKIYKLWEDSGFFAPEAHQPRAGNPNSKKTYTIVIPPPNITGELHMGHALNALIQDSIIRRKRMQGFKTLWLPGTDHAGIAAQNVVEKKLRKEDKTRFDLGKEKFIEEVWAWKEKYGDIILNQFKKIGCSCDWSRTRFTMDKEYSETVKEAFSHYYKKGWIYKGKRIVNWCTRCATSLSDLELEYFEEKSKLWYIKYGPITVATTRPETMLGDTAVAVNPKDEKYKDLVGKTIVLPITKREVPIVADRLVDLSFGTGAVKVTPAHDLCDYQIAQNHNLSSIQVINERGKMTEEVPVEYRGLKVLEAREKILETLKLQRLIEKEEDYIHKVPKCYRCQTTVELIPSEQWFLKMQELAKLAEEPVKNGKIKFHPKSFEKPYLAWLKNVRDWCISRQLWWGHKIPIEGEESVLDTWFSSALWPFATLSPKDLKTYYPTQFLSTARDIINLWVSRMIFSGMEFMKKPPFKDVYIHATVLTKDGRRMSKSLGTGINPIELIERHGADAVRFGLAYQVMGNQDIKFSEDSIIMGKKLCNKIWNASRFVLQQIGITNCQLPISKPTDRKLTSADKKILKQLDVTIKSVNKDFEEFKFGKIAHTLYEFFWHKFCDIYLEKSKAQKDKKQTAKVLLYVLTTSLKIFHPFIPFLTEEIYQTLPIKDKKKCLMIEKWPL
jgi:valyl-tRNA synthetase